jgi:hypothetical protein
MEQPSESTTRQQASRLLKQQRVQLPRRQQTAVTKYLAALHGLIATQLGPEGPSPQLVRYEAALKELTDTLSPPLLTAEQQSTAPPPATSTATATAAALGSSAPALSPTQRSSPDASAQLMQATASMMEVNQVFNLQYLMLQEKMQMENRQYTALSNIMKAKHDAAKNALSNLK